MCFPFSSTTSLASGSAARMAVHSTLGMAASYLKQTAEPANQDASEGYSSVVNS